MSTNYPNRIDSDVEIQTIRDNIAEIGGDTINSLKSAVIAIEKYAGVSTGSTLSLTQRVNRAIDNDGYLRHSAIETAGFLTSPITNSDVDANAGIAESKLTLNYSTTSLQNQINVLRGREDASIEEILSLATTLAGHIHPTAIGAHFATNISYDPTLNTYYLTPAVNPYFSAIHNNVQLAISNNTAILREHKEALSTMSIPFGEHYASAIYFDNNNVSHITSHENVQDALEDALNFDEVEFEEHRSEQHSNGIVRNTRYLMARLAGYRAENAVDITFAQNGSIITFVAGTTLITDGVTNGDSVVISGSTSDDGTYQINEVLSDTTASIVGIFKAADGGNATGTVYLSSLEGGSPVEWSCNCLASTEHTTYGLTNSTEVFVGLPNAAVVIGGEINLPELAEHIWNGGANQRYIFVVRYNNVNVNVDIRTGNFIDVLVHATLVDNLTTENLVRAINKVVVDNHYPFHAFIRDRNQIAIQHDGAEIDSTTPESLTLTDTIRVEDGAAANALTVTYLGFQTGQIGVSTGGTVADPSYPNYSNAYYVNGKRRRELRCLTSNSSYNYVLADINATQTISNFRLASTGALTTPYFLEIRRGDIVRIFSGAINNSYTVGTVVGANSITVRDPLAFAGFGATTGVHVYIYRNSITAIDELTGTTPSVPTMHRVAIDEDGSIFKHRRYEYTTGTGGLYSALKIVNCSRTLAGSANGTAYIVSVGNQVNTVFGATGDWDPADYNSIYDVSGSMTRNTLRFDNGEVIQVDNFNTAGFEASIQIYRVYSENHVDWVDIEVDYIALNALGLGAATNITMTVYEELDEMKNLLLSSCLYNPTGSWENLKFASIIDERYFGTLGDLNVRSDFKESMWEAHKGLGNYILRGLQISIDSGTSDLIWTGGSAFVGGHRIDVEAGSISTTYMNNLTATLYGVYLLEHGEVALYTVAQGRPQVEHVILGVVNIDASGNITAKYIVPNYTNLNEKLLITVSQDPKEGMFTDIKQAVEYAYYVLSIRNSFHDKLLAGNNTYGADIYIKDGRYIVNSGMTVVGNTNIIGIGRPTIVIDDNMAGTHVFLLNGPNRIANIQFVADSGTITNGIIALDNAGVKDVIVENCYFNFTSATNIDSVFYSVGAISSVARFINNYANVNRVVIQTNQLSKFYIQNNIMINSAAARVIDIGTSSASDIHIEGNYIETPTTSRGVYLEGISEVFITNNKMYCTSAVAGEVAYCKNCTKVIVSNNEFASDSTGVCFRVDGTISSDITISSNIFTVSATAYSIHITDTDEVVISNNQINAGYGIYYTCTSYHEDLIITENLFTGCDRNIYLNLNGGNFANLVITNNICEVTSTGRNIYIYGNYALVNTNISNNILSSLGSHNIYISDAILTYIIVNANIIANYNNTLNIYCNIYSSYMFEIVGNIISTGNAQNINITTTDDDVNITYIKNNTMSSSDDGSVEINSADDIEDLFFESNRISAITDATDEFCISLIAVGYLLGIVINGNSLLALSAGLSGGNVNIDGTNLTNIIISSNVLVCYSLNSVSNIDIDMSGTISGLGINSCYVYNASGDNIQINCDILEAVDISNSLIVCYTAGYNVKLTVITTIGGFLIGNNSLQAVSNNNIYVDNPTDPIVYANILNNYMITDTAAIANIVFAASSVVSKSSIVGNMLISTDSSNVDFNGTISSDVNILQNYMEDTVSTVNRANISIIQVTTGPVNIFDNFIYKDAGSRNIEVTTSGSYISVCRNYIYNNGSVTNIYFNAVDYLFVDENMISSDGTGCNISIYNGCDYVYVRNNILFTNGAGSNESNFLIACGTNNIGFYDIIGNYCETAGGENFKITSTSSTNVRKLNLKNNVFTRSASSRPSIYIVPADTFSIDIYDSTIEENYINGDTAQAIVFGTNTSTVQTSVFMLKDNIICGSGAGAATIFMNSLSTTNLNVIVDGNFVQNSGAGRSFIIANASFLLVENNMFYSTNPGEDTFKVTFSCGLVSILNNMFFNLNSVACVCLDDISNVKFVGNQLFVAGTAAEEALDMDSVTHFIVNSNNIINNSVAGLNPATTAIHLDASCSYGIISDNYILYNGFSVYIGGDGVTQAGALDTIHISDNFPGSTDLTFRNAVGTDTWSYTVSSEAVWGGGGCLWADCYASAADTDYLLDDTMDYRYRYIEFAGLVAPDDTYLPNTYDMFGNHASVDFIHDAFFSSSGNIIGDPTDKYGLVDSHTGDIRLYVDSTNGYLRAYRQATHITNLAFALRINYSPVMYTP